MKDYIEITDQFNNKRTVEVVTTFKLKQYNSNYIIYKELDIDSYFIAKYQGEDVVDLDTNLTQEELSLIKKIFEGVLQWN